MTLSIRRLLPLSCLLTAVCMSASLSAGTLSFNGTTDKSEAVYQPGEKMTFSVQLLEDGKPVAGKKLKWVRQGDDQKEEKGEAVSSDTQPLTITTALSTPGFVHLMVDVFDSDGKQIKNEKNQPIRFDGGAGVELEKIQSIPEPADFDAFWAKQKARLKEVPIKASFVETTQKRDGFDVYDIRIDCPGGKPVSGYLAIPKDAKPKSMPAQLLYQGYSVSGAGLNTIPGKIALTINAHGIGNGREKDYYTALGQGELKGYGFNTKGNEDPETAYFNGMALRVLRSLEYMKTRPEWNGKDLIVTGGSQGGLQSMWAAGLDPDVTNCNVGKPWCCDLGGVTLGRLKGWRPDWVPALGYYDPVNLGKRVKCPVQIHAGLGDYTCPPSGITALYNAIKTPKKITYVQGATHMADPKDAQKFVRESK